MSSILAVETAPPSISGIGYHLLQVLRENHGREFRRLSRMQPDADRRCDPRFTLTIPFLLSPVIEVDGRLLETWLQPIQAVAKDFSRCGIGFRCDALFGESLAIAEFDAVKNGPLRCLLSMRWRRSRTDHHHLCGAAITRLLTDDA